MIPSSVCPLFYQSLPPWFFVANRESTPINKSPAVTSDILFWGCFLAYFHVELSQFFFSLQPLTLFLFWAFFLELLEIVDRKPLTEDSTNTTHKSARVRKTEDSIFCNWNIWITKSVCCLLEPRDFVLNCFFTIEWNNNRSYFFLGESLLAINLEGNWGYYHLLECFVHH